MTDSAKTGPVPPNASNFISPSLLSCYSRFLCFAWLYSACAFLRPGLCDAVFLCNVFVAVYFYIYLDRDSLSLPQSSQLPALRRAH